MICIKQTKTTGGKKKLFQDWYYEEKRLDWSGQKTYWPSFCTNKLLFTSDIYSLIATAAITLALESFCAPANAHIQRWKSCSFPESL